MSKISELGQIDLIGDESIALARNKVSMLAKSLGFSAFEATRLATVTSIFARQLTRLGDSGRVMADLARRRDGYRLRLRYIDLKGGQLDVTSVQSLLGRALITNSDGDTEISTSRNDLAGQITPASIASAREIVARLNPREAALKAARDQLDKKVQERTASLRESELRFRQLTENIHEVFWIFDIATADVLYVSPSYETIWQRKESDLYARPNDWFEGVHPDDRDAISLALQSLAEQPEWQQQYRIVRPDQTERLIRDRRFPVQDADGKIVRFAGIAEDITEQSQLELQLRQSQKMEAIGTLAGGIAHDFNNLLMVILGHADILAQEIEESNPLRESVDEMTDAGIRARNLTRQLLAFSRREDPEPRVLDPNAIIDSMTKMLRRLIGANIELRLVLNDDLDRVEIDPGQLEQLLTNLVVNARDAMPDGGRLVLESSHVALNEQDASEHVGARAGAYVMVSVTDTGHGMDDAVKSRIFEPFFTTKEAGKGTGLGLATVFGIVKQYSGYISVESKPGSGATFNVCLPATDAAAESKKELSTITPPRNRSGSILVVEDETAIRKLVVGVLERAGYSVISVADAEQALDLFEARSAAIDLLLSDIVLPKMDGIELANLLRKQNPELRVLHMSGYSYDAKRAHENIDGGDATLRKPITPAALIEAVNTVMSR